MEALSVAICFIGVVIWDMHRRHLIHLTQAKVDVNDELNHRLALMVKAHGELEDKVSKLTMAGTFIGNRKG